MVVDDNSFESVSLTFLPSLNGLGRVLHTEVMPYICCKNSKLLDNDKTFDTRTFKKRAKQFV